MKIYMNSQVRRYQKFMADKNIHSWCGTGSESPIPGDFVILFSGTIRTAKMKPSLVVGLPAATVDRNYQTIMNTNSGSS
jgi:hypothetical protein